MISIKISTNTVNFKQFCTFRYIYVHAFVRLSNLRSKIKKKEKKKETKKRNLEFNTRKLWKVLRTGKRKFHPLIALNVIDWTSDTQYIIATSLSSLGCMAYNKRWIQLEHNSSILFSLFHSFIIWLLFDYKPRVGSCCGINRKFAIYCNWHSPSCFIDCINFPFKNSAFFNHITKQTAKEKINL